MVNGGRALIAWSLAIIDAVHLAKRLYLALVHGRSKNRELVICSTDAAGGGDESLTKLRSAHHAID